MQILDPLSIDLGKVGVEPHRRWRIGCDLSLKFRQNEFGDVLGLLPGGEVVTVELTGVLEDGTPFCARDCIRLVPQGN